MADTKKSCTDSVDLYEDLLKCPGAKRLPGTGRRVFLAPRRYITALAKPQLEKAASMKDYLVIKESHTMAADKKFIVAYLATDKSNFSSESQRMAARPCSTSSPSSSLAPRRSSPHSPPCCSMRMSSHSSLSATASAVSMVTITLSAQWLLLSPLVPPSQTRPAPLSSCPWVVRPCHHSTMVTSQPLRASTLVRLET